MIVLGDDIYHSLKQWENYKSEFLLLNTHKDIHLIHIF